MVRIPPVNNQATMRRKQSNIFQAVGISLFLDLIEAKKEAYFLDVESGNNAIGALSFRLSNAPNDLLNFFTGQPLAPVPTVQDVIDNPADHFRRLMIGTNLDVRRAIAEDPNQAAAINAGLQSRRSAGETLAQVVANAVNADKDTRTAFDSYLIQARQMAVETIENATESATAGLDEGLARLVNGLSDFFVEALFARPRRTGDNKRVSKEQHEFNYLSTVKISSYGNNLFGNEKPDGYTHLEAALGLLQLNFTRAPNESPGLQPGSDVGNFEQLEDAILEGFFDLDADCFDAARFSYGNFIDSYHMRRLLAELKKLVQGSRVDNITEFLERTGTTRPEYLSNILHRLSPNGFISLAGNELVANCLLEPTKPVREFIAGIEVVQPFGGTQNPPVVPEGPILNFRAPEQSSGPPANLTIVDE